ncbi:hypothetical protein FNF27_00860 [Cafeteria roenbergensis]|uniref:Exonuclease domain-containing protein n=1 Tax=Cafeteria roenbergensis TaxID=33653 RepID=A0A5A8EKL2_CAFRO|nr:hypothetical protein FNF27_00860 [Cafeteria roenbergensis]
MAAARAYPSHSTRPAFVAVLDVEATRRPSDRSFRQEIVELPVAVIDARPGGGRGKLGGTVAAVFHTFVKPTENPRLNFDTTSFMPISQADVDAAPTLGVALQGMHLFLETIVPKLGASDPHSVVATAGEGGHGERLVVSFTLTNDSRRIEGSIAVGEIGEWTLVGYCASGADTAPLEALLLRTGDASAMDGLIMAADGPWDIACYLAHEVQRKRLQAHWRSYLSKWWNIRWAVGSAKCGGSVRGLNVVSQLAQFGLRFVGTEHSGIDDTLNIVSIARALLGYGSTPRANDGLSRTLSVLTGRVFTPVWYNPRVPAEMSRL